MDWADRALCKGSALWTEIGKGDDTSELVAGCLERCEVLAECRQYATRFPWAAVVVAGHYFHAHQPRYPPWSP